MSKSLDNVLFKFLLAVIFVVVLFLNWPLALIGGLVAIGIWVQKNQLDNVSRFVKGKQQRGEFVIWTTVIVLIMLVSGFGAQSYNAQKTHHSEHQDISMVVANDQANA